MESADKLTINTDMTMNEIAFWKMAEAWGCEVETQGMVPTVVHRTVRSNGLANLWWHQANDTLVYRSPRSYPVDEIVILIRPDLQLDQGLEMMLKWTSAMRELTSGTAQSYAKV